MAQTMKGIVKDFMWLLIFLLFQFCLFNQIVSTDFQINLFSNSCVIWTPKMPKGYKILQDMFHIYIVLWYFFDSCTNNWEFSTCIFYFATFVIDFFSDVFYTNMLVLKVKNIFYKSLYSCVMLFSVSCFLLFVILMFLIHCSMIHTMSYDLQFKDTSQIYGKSFSNLNNNNGHDDSDLYCINSTIRWTISNICGHRLQNLQM